MAKRFLPILAIFILSILLLSGLLPQLVEAQTSQTLHVSKWTEYAENPTFGQGVDSGPKAYYPSVLYDVNEFSGHGHSAKYKMWYGTSGAQTALATSDDGLNWTDQGVVMTNGYHAVVEYYPDGFTGANSGDNPSSATMYYRMWYWVESGLWSSPPKPIRYAESPDGFNWYNDQAITGNLFTGVSLEWNRTSYGPIDVLYNPTATDTGTNPFDYSFVMYFDATEGNFEEIGLGYSSDGINWNLYGKVLPRGNDGPWQNTDDWDSCYASFGTVIKEANGKWHMWYSGGTSGVNHGIGHATSTDGLAWTRDAGNPLLHVTDGVDWRNNRTYCPMVIEDGGIYKMWFSGKDATGNYAIGYATADGPFPSIQGAINAASAGDTIIVHDGMYNENVDVSKSLSLVASSTINVTALDANDHVFEVTADYVNISGFTVGGATAAEKAGIYLDQVESCNISANTCLDNCYGIYLDGIGGSHSNTLNGNTANQNSECGIYLDNSSNNTLTDNAVSGNGEYGINLDGSNNNTLTGNRVTGNKIGVEIDGSVDASTISINFNSIYTNTNYGVSNQAAATVNATNNWWGDASGPTHAENPAGTGDRVSDNVNYAPWLGADIEEVKTETITGSGIIDEDDTVTGIGDIDIDATGEHTVTTSKYEDNPGGTPTFQATGDYYDVHLDDDTDVNSLTIEFCPAEPDTVIYYWNGTNWEPASNQSYSDGCIVVTITDSTFPSLSDLTGLPFGSGTPYPPIAVGGEVYPINKVSVLAPWLGLILILAIGGGILFLRRRRAH